jgi:hypothetical protein
LELSQRLDSVKERCHDKVAKMERTINHRREELRSAIAAKLTLIPTRIEEEREQVNQDEDILRREWERVISNKLEKEFRERSSNFRQTTKAKQESEILDIIGELERETRIAKQELEERIEKEQREHRICASKLQRRFNDFSLELEALKDETDLDEIRKEIDNLKQSLANCECTKLRRDILEANRNMIDLEERINLEHQRQTSAERKVSQEFETLQTQLLDGQNTKRILEGQLASLRKELDSKRDSRRAAIVDAEQKHKEQITLIGERVKQTVAKKDQVIEQLKGKIERYGRSHGS